MNGLSGGGGVKVPGSYNFYLPCEVQQFWYYRTLFVYIVVSPILIVLARNFKRGLAVVVGLWLLAFLGCPGQHQYFSWLTDASFAFGVFWGLHSDKVESLFLKVKWFHNISFLCFLLCIIVAMLFCAWFRLRIVYNRLMYLIIPIGVGVCFKVSPYFVRFFKPCESIFSLNVFIFAIHLVVLWRVKGLFYSLNFDLNSVYILCLEYFLVLSICVVLGLIFKKMFPRVLRHLSGGRG